MSIFMIVSYPLCIHPLVYFHGDVRVGILFLKKRRDYEQNDDLDTFLLRNSTESSLIKKLGALQNGRARVRQLQVYPKSNVQYKN